MDIAFLVLASLAALLHVYIFVLETFLWTKPAAQNVFGTTEQFAQATKEMAANQGVYNGALAVLVLIGAGVTITGNTTVGHSLMLAGVSVMTIAAIYLFASSPNKRSAAIKQLVLPLSSLIVYCLLVVL